MMNKQMPEFVPLYYFVVHSKSTSLVFVPRECKKPNICTHLSKRVPSNLYLGEFLLFLLNSRIEGNTLQKSESIKCTLVKIAIIVLNVHIKS